MSKSQNYVVWNSIDNITTHPGTFSNKKDAENFREEFVKRYTTQGYYRDNQWNKVPLTEVKGRLMIITEQELLKRIGLSYEN